MIGQHPKLYGFPELNLFLADRLETLLALDAGPELLSAGNYSSGLQRVVAELFFDGQTPAALASAAGWMEKRRRVGTAAIIDLLLNRIHPRTGVEKSTRTAMWAASMERARTWYPQARFIHLLRHPIAAIQSMTRGTPDDIGFVEYSANVWLHSHCAISRFLATLPPAQVFCVQAEKILRDPDQRLPHLMAWLEIGASKEEIEAMKRPENSPYARALEGVPADSDAGFLAQPRLRAIPEDPPLEIPAHWRLSRVLALRLTEMAQQFGYGL